MKREMSDAYILIVLIGILAVNLGYLFITKVLTFIV